MNKVLILMSTYNGEEYIREQLDSIVENMNQDIKIDLLIRDDGSDDNTIAILSEYKNILGISCIRGENIGVAQSFRELIEICPLGYDAYAFADQDDIWEREKIPSAIERIKQHSKNVPVLWYCGVILYSHGKLGSRWHCPYSKATCFEAIVDSFCSTNGCTMVFNESLLLALRSCQKGVIDMHDSFTHALCLAVGGDIYVDERPLVRYRIHEKQVLGSNNNSFIKQMRRIMNPARLRSSTIKVLLTSNLIIERHAKYLLILNDYKKLKNKLCLILRRRPCGMTKKECIKFKIQVILNAY